jgi:signal transduction histidine kinase
MAGVNDGHTAEDVIVPFPADQSEDSTAVLCHRLRTPLTSALGYIQLLVRSARQREDNAPDLRQLTVIDEQLRAMARIIDELAATPR